jgi:catechol 2,3-dioxygenase-like lactoylglutathione lyase family enzyme
MEEPRAGDRPSWTASRVARPARDLARSVRFYRDLLGLPVVGGFEGHAGYDGVFFGLPGGGELELTAGPVQPAPATEEDLLVLYLRTHHEVEATGARLTAAGVTRVAAPNPYWNRTGQTYLDPDGYRLVVATDHPVTGQQYAPHRP